MIDPAAVIDYGLPMDRAILENPNFNYKDYLESKRHQYFESVQDAVDEDRDEVTVSSIDM